MSLNYFLPFRSFFEQLYPNEIYFSHYSKGIIVQKDVYAIIMRLRWTFYDHFAKPWLVVDVFPNIYYTMGI